MKKIFRNALLCGGLLATITACNSEDSIAPLEVKVAAQSASSRAGLIEDQVLPNGSSIGVTMVENVADATSYDESIYSNLEYTSDDGRDWNVVGTNVPMLTSTPGKAIAYYPWKTGADYKNLEVEILSQTDYMYSGWYSGSGNKNLDNSNPEAQFQMKHALSAFRIKLLKDQSYGALAKVTKVVVNSASFNTTGVYSAETGQYISKSGEGTYTYNFTSTYPELTTTAMDVDIMVVPATTVPSGNKASFTVTVQDAASNTKDYVVSPSFEAVMAQGTIYEFTLTLFPTEMKCGEVSVKTWDIVTGGSGQLKPADLNSGN